MIITNRYDKQKKERKGDREEEKEWKIEVKKKKKQKGEMSIGKKEIKQYERKDRVLNNE